MSKECTDCKHCKPYIGAFGFRFKELDICTSTKTTNKYKYCDTQRTNGWPLYILFNSCGKRGRHWEKK